MWARRSGGCRRACCCGRGGLRAGELVAAAPAYIKMHSDEWVYWTMTKGVCPQHGPAYYPKLVLAVPFNPVTGGRLADAPGLSPAVERQVLRAGCCSGESGLPAGWPPPAHAVSARAGLCRPADGGARAPSQSLPAAGQRGGSSGPDELAPETVGHAGRGLLPVAAGAVLIFITTATAASRIFARLRSHRRLYKARAPRLVSCRRDGAQSLRV